MRRRHGAVPTPTDRAPTSRPLLLGLTCRRQGGAQIPNQILEERTGQPGHRLEDSGLRLRWVERKIIGPSFSLDGSLWFTERNGNKVGRITLGQIFTLTEFGTGITAASQPTGIAGAFDGTVWFTEQAANKVARITNAGTVTEFTIPTANSQPTGIAFGPDGALWFTEQAGNKIGRITPPGAMGEFPIPTANSQPSGIVAGPDGNVWFTEFAGNKVVQVISPFTAIKGGVRALLMGSEARERLTVLLPPGHPEGRHVSFRYQSSSFDAFAKAVSTVVYLNVRTPLATVSVSGRVGHVTGRLFRAGDTFTITLSNVKGVPHATVVVSRGATRVLHSVLGPRPRLLAGSYLTILTKKP